MPPGLEPSPVDHTSVPAAGWWASPVKMMSRNTVPDSSTSNFGLCSADAVATPGTLGGDGTSTKINDTRAGDGWSLGQAELPHVEVAGPEPGLRVGQVELPHPPERLVEAEPGHLAPAVQEPPPPDPQGQRVVLAEGPVVQHPQPGVLGDGVLD